MEKRSVSLGSDKISKLLLKLSLPATIGMIVNALYNIVDTIFIGRWVSISAIGGLAIAFPIQMVIMAFALMVGIGAASAISRSLGAKDTERADYVAGNSFLVIVILSGVTVALGFTFMEPILRIFGATDTLLPYAKDYMSIIFLGSIFFSFTVASNNLVRAEGNAKVAMFSMVIGTGLNIVLDPIFIYFLKMGIKGAAIATIISEFVSFIYIITYLYSGKSSLKIQPHHLKLKKDILKEIFAVGSSSFVRQIAGSIVAIVLNHSLKYYGGDLEISILGVVNRITMFLYMPLFGIAQGMQPIAGFNYGARKMNRVNEVVKLSIITTTVIASVGFIVIEAIPVLIMSIFNKDTNFINSGAFVMRIVIFMLPIVGIQIAGSTFFQSLGKAVPSLILSLLRQVLIFIPLVLILPIHFGLLGIWIAFPIADLLSTIVTFVLLRNEMKKISIVVESPF